ncbi:MAG: tRNA dihydrouridine synthase DusB [Erysipelotrichaceae bacterium]|nr:tRNA dihydrouridine synthase DusB [Erysipelotrichaceae bacterium]
MLKINEVEIKERLIVAPMAGISNEAFRELCFEFGAGLVYTEMVSDKAIYYRNNKTMDMLKIGNEHHPVSLQLFGSDVNTMVYAAQVLDRETNCDLIDINMGCPVSKVVKTGAGSAMMKDEEHTVEIVKEVVKHVSKPVTVKMRLGWDLQHMNYVSLAKKLEDAGVRLIALHARTRSQMYEGLADWSHIRILKENLSIPVIGNGDVKSVEDFQRMLDETGCDAVMIGRALVGNPFLLKQIDDHLHGHETGKYDASDKLDYCLIHAKKLIGLYGEKNALSQMRGLAPHYLTGMYGAASYKARLNQIRTYDDLENIIEEYRGFLIQKEQLI